MLKITTDMMLLFSNVSSLPTFAGELAALEARFAAWYAALPDQLRIDDVSSLSQSPPPHIASLK